MHRLFAFLLILALMLPPIALADTQYINEAMKLNLTLPTGWELEKYERFDTIKNIALKSMLLLVVADVADAKSTLPFLDRDTLMLIIDAALEDDTIQVLSHFTHTAGDNPITGLTFTISSFPVPMNGAAWFYPAENDMAGMAILLTPVDDPPDVSWFTDALHALFPALSSDQTTPYTHEAMGLSFSVPDGWIIAHDDDSDTIDHAARESRIMLSTTDMPNVKRLFPLTDAENLLQKFFLKMPSDTFEVLSIYSYETADSPIIGMSFKDMASFDVPMNCSAYLFPCGDDTMAAIILATPINDPPDMSWFTDVMEAKFPELSDANANQYTNQAMELRLTVPDGWEIEFGTNGEADCISNAASTSMVLLSAEDLPKAKHYLPILTQETIVDMMSSLADGEDIEVLSYHNDTSADQPVLRITCTFQEVSMPMYGQLYLYPVADDTLAMILAATPVEAQQEVSWLISAMEERFPQLSAANTTPYVNEAMELSFALPEGWEAGSVDSAGDYIRHAASSSEALLYHSQEPLPKGALEIMSQDVVMTLVPSKNEKENVQILSYFNHASSEHPIVGVTYAFTRSSVQMNGLIYLYLAAEDALAVITLVTPADHPPDVSWFADTIEKKFPQLSTADTTPYVNEAMGLRFALPEGWEAGSVDGNGDYIRHAVSKSEVMLVCSETSLSRTSLALMSQDMVMKMIPWQRGEENVQVLSYFNYASSDHPILGLTCAFVRSSTKMVGQFYLYITADDTMAVISMVTPADNSPDVSWLTDAMEALFPGFSTAK